MQSLIFETKEGAVTLGNQAPYILSNLDLGEVDRSKVVYKNTGQHGVSLKNYTMGPRMIRAKCVVLGASEEELFSRRRLLGKRLNPGSEGTLYYDNGYTKYKIAAGVDSSIVYEDWIGQRRGQFFTLKFYCPSPFFMDIHEWSRDFMEITPKLHFPLGIKPGFVFSSLAGGELVINNRGDIPCGMRVEIMGPASRPRIINHTTGAFIHLAYELTAGKRIVVTTHFGDKRVTVINADGSETSGFHYLTFDSTFFSLACGENRIQFKTEEGFDQARATLYYTPGYLAV